MLLSNCTEWQRINRQLINILILYLETLRKNRVSDNLSRRKKEAAKKNGNRLLVVCVAAPLRSFQTTTRAPTIPNLGGCCCHSNMGRSPQERKWVIEWVPLRWSFSFPESFNWSIIDRRELKGPAGGSELSDLGKNFHGAFFLLILFHPRLPGDVACFSRSQQPAFYMSGWQTLMKDRISGKEREREVKALPIGL